MFRKSATKAVAAVLMAALSMGSVAMPAAAMAETLPDSGAIVAQSVGSDDAIEAALDTCPVAASDVASVTWYYDEPRNDYVVTVTAISGDWWVVWVDVTTGIVWQIS